MNRTALIVAGGSGSRMGMDIPKQFILLNDKPVLYYSLLAFSKICEDIVLVLPTTEFERWESLCRTHNISIKHRIVAGGKERSDSVRNGLESIKNNGFVAIHDAARPFVSSELIKHCFEEAEKFGNAIPMVKPKESLRMLTDDGNVSVNREIFHLVQTPQVFEIEKLKDVFNQTLSTSFTDEASRYECIFPNSIHRVEGNYSNIKLTTSDDLNWADYFIRNI